jgi:signal transduction histidine kinase
VIVRSRMLEIAEIELNAVVDGKSPEIVFTIKDKYHTSEKIEKINWNNIITNPALNGQAINTPRCGPVEVKLYFYLNSSSLLSGTEFKLSDLRTFLNQNAGVRIYRDSIAVKPYGYTNGQSDWLGLAERKARDPAGISRETYKITPNQLVGAIFVSRDDNSSIIDSGAREGLIENEAFSDLKDLLLACVRLLETHRFNITKEKPKPNSDARKNKAENIKNITANLSSVKDNLKRIGTEAPQLALPINSSIKTIDDTIDETEKVFNDILGENRVLNGLATLGIASAVFGHETQTAINQVAISVKNIREEFSILPIDEQSIEEEIATTLKSSKTISAWGSFALTRVQNEKRRLASKNIKKIIEDTIKEIRPSFEASSVEVEVDAEQIVSKVYPMDIESIIINLITNSYTACMASNSELGRKIRIKLIRANLNDISGYYIKVSDSGPGIHQDLIERVWEPLFSTKSNNSSIKTGTGLGLSIVKSIVGELNGITKADNDSDLGGALIEIWIPKN